MEKDILVILMVAFGLFAIIMFILFFVYLRKFYNSRHTEEDYKKELDQKAIEEDEDIIEVASAPVNEEVVPMPPISPISVEPAPVPQVSPVNIEPIKVDVVMPVLSEEVTPKVDEIEPDVEFVPIKKK